jgi:hypothetical protein
VPVPSGGDTQGVGLGDWFAQQADECVVDARVLDASGSEEKFHSMKSIANFRLTGKSCFAGSRASGKIGGRNSSNSCWTIKVTQDVPTEAANCATVVAKIHDQERRDSMGCLGVLFALTRKQLERLLEANSDDQVKKQVRDMSEKGCYDFLVDTDKSWDAIHRCLSDGTLDFEGGTYPLNHCILAGKQLHEGKNYIVSFKRPDEVRDIAAALKKVTEPWFRERYFALTKTDFPQEICLDDEWDYTLHYLKHITEFYQQATMTERAVIFKVSL